MAGAVTVSQDWEPVVIRKKAPNAAAKEGEKAANANRWSAAGIEAPKKGLILQLDHVSIISPLKFGITGMKLQGTETKTIVVLGQFIPKHLSAIKEVKDTIAKGCAMVMCDFRVVEDFDLTIVTEEKLNSIVLAYPCTRCGVGGCYGVVKVEMHDVYNGLLYKEKYVEFQLNCKSEASVIGSVMFSKLKKPATGFKQKLSKVGEKAKKALPYVTAAVSISAGSIELGLNG